MRTRLHTTLPTLTALLLALSACTSSPAPKPPPLEPSGTSVAAPTENPTTPAPAPQQETPAEFLRRWAMASDEAQRTGDLAQFNKLWSGCFSCVAFVKNVKGVYDRGGRIEVGETRIEDIETVGRTTRSITLDATIRTPTTRIIEGDGSSETIQSGSQPVRIYLQRSENSWVMTAYSGRQQ